MRLAFCDNSRETFRTHRLPLAQYCASLGIEVWTVLPSSGRIRAVTYDGQSVGIRLDRVGMSLIAHLALIVTYIWVFRRIRPQVIHLRTPKVWVFGGIAARLARVPAVVSHITGIGSALSLRGWRGTVIRCGMRVLAPWCFGHTRQRVIVQNRDDAVALLKLGCPRRKLRMIRGSGVDCAGLRPTPPPPAPPLIVLPARMLADKGVHEFVAAAEIVRNQGVQARFALVGTSDPGNPSCVPEATLAAWHASGVIEWWGFQSDMAAVYAQAHIVCLPSYYGEGLPKTLLEAMACGLPVVTCDTPGCREPVIPEVTGLLVPMRDASALAIALKRLIADAGLRQRMGTAGRAHCEAHFALPHIVRLTYGVIAAVAPPRR